jgi:hypothetical protein
VLPVSKRRWAGRIARLGAALVMAGAVAGLAGPGTAAAAGCDPATQPTTPADVGPLETFTGVAALPGCNVWAVGEYQRTDRTFRTLIQHWTGGSSWTVVPSPNPHPASKLNAVSAVSATDIWAVGETSSSAGSSAGLVVHWDGSNWTSMADAPPSGHLNAVAAVSATSVWVAGADNSGLVLSHWDGTGWTSSPIPPLTPAPDGQLFALDGLAATSASDIWAVGDYSTSASNNERPLILHWDGSQWSQADGIPDPANGVGLTQLTAVSASSPADAWAVGLTAGAGHPIATVTLHWDGHSWALVPSPSPSRFSNELEGVVAVSPSSAFAVGVSDSRAGKPDQSVMLHWDGHGWTPVATPNPGDTENVLLAAAAGPGGAVWAVGASANSDIVPRATRVEAGLVPNVLGASRAGAVDAVNGAGLGVVVNDVTTAGGECSPDRNGTVIAQLPGAGVFTGVPVTLSVCSVPPPPSTVRVPNVMTFDDTSAQNSITAAGLAVGSVTTTSNCAVKAGDVVFQSPDAGTVVAAGSQVNLVEASGLGPNKKRCPVL